MGAKALAARALLGFCNLLAIVAIALFVPAGSLHFWQAWTFLLVFFSAVLTITLYFLKRDPHLVESRVKAGPIAETQPVQKLVQTLAGISFIGLFIVAGLDHRFRWSAVPLWLVAAGTVLVALGLLSTFLVFRENTFTSAIVEVSEQQRVVSTGPYRVVRHPMYSGALLICLSAPLALGSFAALLPAAVLCGAIVWRLIDEERFLAAHLPGYDDYRGKTRFRLIPFIW